jgi:hypothetical protein
MRFYEFLFMTEDYSVEEENSYGDHKSTTVSYLTSLDNLDELKEAAITGKTELENNFDNWSDLPSEENAIYPGLLGHMARGMYAAGGFGLGLHALDLNSAGQIIINQSADPDKVLLGLGLLGVGVIFDIAHSVSNREWRSENAKARKRCYSTVGSLESLDDMVKVAYEENIFPQDDPRYGQLGEIQGILTDALGKARELGCIQ